MKNIRMINKNGMVMSAQLEMETPVYINSIEVYTSKEGKTCFELPGYKHKKEDGEWATRYYAVPASSEAYAALAKAVDEAIANGKMKKVSVETRPNLQGYVSVQAANMVVSLSYTEDGRVIVPSRKDKNGKYWNYIGISKEQAEAAKAEFQAELAKGGATAADVNDDGAAVVE